MTFCPSDSFFPGSEFTDLMIMELCRGHLAKALLLVVIVAEPAINSGLHGLL